MAQDDDLSEDLRDHLREAWHRFIDVTAPIRPGLHRYCLRLTGDVWDAEDLLQDALLKAFGQLGRIDDPIGNPRAYLVKTATSLWLDRKRRALRAETAFQQLHTLAEAAAPAPNTDMHDAARVLTGQLNERQAAALLMKEVFGMGLAECAEALETTEAAIKSLLSRAREKLPIRESEPYAPEVSEALVENFVRLFNVGDIEGLLKLVLDNATVGNVGTDMEWGRDGHRGPYNWFKGAVGGHRSDWPEAFRFEAQRTEQVVFQGEPIVLLWRTRKGEEAVESLLRITEDESRITALRSYSFTPETKVVVCEALGVPVRPGRYRYPTPAPGKRFSDDG